MSNPALIAINASHIWLFHITNFGKIERGTNEVVKTAHGIGWRFNREEIFLCSSVATAAAANYRLNYSRRLQPRDSEGGL